MNLLFVATVWIVLHTVDGNEIFIDPEDIMVMRETTEAIKGTANELTVPGARCSVGLANGRHISVTELCAVVRELIEKAEKPKELP